WTDVHRYVEQKHTHGTTAAALFAPSTVTLRYDVAGWIAAGMPNDASAFRLPSPQPYVFELRPAAARELDALTRVWTLSLRGLTKGITRLRTPSLERVSRPASGSLEVAAG